MDMLTPPETLERLDALQRNINDVLVHTSKAFKGAMRGSQFDRPSLEQASLVVRDGVHDSYKTFNYALDDLETEINRAKAVLLRDLGELRAKRMPPATPPPEEEQPVAPPAPMDFHIDLTSFAQDSASGLTTDQSQPFHFQGSGGNFKQENKEDNKPDVKQESKPVAPVPNMDGFDFSVSPEAAKVPSPALAQVKAKAIKGSPKPSPKLKVAQTARPSSAPPKKEPRATVSPQLPRTAAPTPQPAAAPTPVAPPAPMQAAPMNVPLPASRNPAPTSAPAPAPSPVPPAPVPVMAPQPEMVFTDMAFSVDDSQGLGQMNMSSQNAQQQNQQDQQEMDDMIDLTQFTDFGAPDQNESGTTGRPTGGTSSNNVNINNSNNNNTTNNNDNNSSDNSQFVLNSNNDISNVDAEINDILNSTGPDSAEKMDMDYELGSIGLDNNSFDDMFFADNASGGEAEYGNDSSYYGV